MQGKKHKVRKEKEEASRKSMSEAMYLMKSLHGIRASTNASQSISRPVGIHALSTDLPVDIVEAMPCSRHRPWISRTIRGEPLYLASF